MINDISTVINLKSGERFIVAAIGARVNEPEAIEVRYLGRSFGGVITFDNRPDLDLFIQELENLSEYVFGGNVTK